MTTSNLTYTAKSIDLPGRTRLEYVEHGDPTGVPVLFLHGFTDSWHSFELVLPHFPPSIHAFALTQRGHGDSARPEAGYEISDFVGDVLAFLDAMEIDRAVIAGHSMGGHIAQTFAIEHPERVRGLVLMGAFTNFRDTSVDEFFDEVSKLSDPIAPEFAREFQLATTARPLPAGYLDLVVDESLKLPARVWTATITGFMDFDSRQQLDQIKAPTQIVWGDQDSFSPRSHQDALAQGIADAELIIYEGTGHALHWEEPERFSADLVRFVQRI